MKRNFMWCFAAVCVIALIFDKGVPITILLLSVLIATGIAVFIPFWVLGFVLLCVFGCDVRTAWNMLNPVVLFKECFIEKTE